MAPVCICRKSGRGCPALPGGGRAAEVKFLTKPEIALELIARRWRTGCRGPRCWGIMPMDQWSLRDGLRVLTWSFFCKWTRERFWVGTSRAVEPQRTRWRVRKEQPKRCPWRVVAGQKNIQWQPCSWKACDGQTRHTRLAWMKVIWGVLGAGAAKLEELWLVVDWPAGEAEPLSLLSAHLRGAHKRCDLRLSRSRWNIEQYFQRGKTDLGLDHFEGAVGGVFTTTWSCRAGVSLCHDRLSARKKNFWCDVEQTLRMLRPWLLRWSGSVVVAGENLRTFLRIQT